MLVAIGCYLAILALAFGCDALAKRAGVRWNRKWAWIMLLIVGTFGAVVGGMDGGVRASVVGLVLGCVFGQIAGSIVYGTNAFITALLFGPAPIDPKAPREPATPRRRLAILFAGPLPILFSVVCAHELFWMANMLTSHAQYQVGLAMVEAEPSDAGRKSLVKALHKTRWRLDVATQLPVRLLIHPDDEAAIRGTIAYVDFLDGAPPPEVIPAAWKGSIDDQLLWAIWNEKGEQARGMLIVRLDACGARIGNAAHDRLERHLERTWVMRFLPRAVFVGRDVDAAR